MNLKELYQEIILEHGKNPNNFGKTVNYNKDAQGNNPLCGDNVSPHSLPLTAGVKIKQKKRSPSG